MDINLLSPLTLSFVGDVYYSLLVRSRLAEVNRPVGELHSKSVKLVNAGAQAKVFKYIEPMLTEKELLVYKRGRNAHAGHTPKNKSEAQYHKSTGFEALVGYLYLKKDFERLDFIFSEVLKNE